MFIAYLSSLTSVAYTATQYALLSSLYALPGKFVGGLRWDDRNGENWLILTETGEFKSPTQKRADSPDPLLAAAGASVSRSRSA